MDSKILEHECSRSGKKFSLFGVLSSIPLLQIDGIAHADLVDGSVELKVYRRTGVHLDGAEITTAVHLMRFSPETFQQFAQDVQYLSDKLLNKGEDEATSEISELAQAEESPSEELGIRLS